MNILGSIGPRKVDKPLVIYGYGRLGHLAEEIFKELGVRVVNIVTNEIPWVRTRSSNKTQEYKAKTLLAICVATEPYSQVIAPLVASGWTDIVPVWDIIEAYPEVGIRNGWFCGEITDEDAEGIDVVDWGFCDLSSRGHYLSFREWHCKRDEWLPKNIEPKKSLPSSLADIRARQCLHVFPSSDCGYIPSEISIHAEGFEYETLNLNLNILQTWRPKMEVACYHSRDGLWKIPKFLMDNLPDYDFKFRLHSFQGQGAYIYATPKERGEG